MPAKLRKQLSTDPFMSKCARKELLQDHTCQGRITWEHVFIFAGKQIQEDWAIIPLCELAHSVNRFQDSGILNKQINKWIALNRATDLQLIRHSVVENYIYERRRLNSIYGFPDFGYVDEVQYVYT